MLSAKQGNHWYHCFNFIGWVRVFWETPCS